MSTELPRDLEDAIVASPHDRENYAVAGDWLTDRGDLQGELVALQLAALGDPTSDRILELQTRLAPVSTGREGSTALEWRWGFIHGAFYSGVDVAELGRLLAAPVARFLHKLVLSSASPRLIEQLVAVRRSGPLRCLRTLLIGQGIGRPRAIDLGPLALFSSLQRLGLRLADVRDRLDLPQLRELVLSELPAPEQLIASSDLPALERLQVAKKRTVSPLEQWLGAAYVPKLRRLTLHGEQPLLYNPPQPPSQLFDQLVLFDQFVARTGTPMMRMFTVDRTPPSSEAGLVVMVGRAGRVPGTLIRISDRFRIGRSNENDLALADPDMTDRHATFHSGHRWSFKGPSHALTYIEGHPIPGCALRDDDELSLGRHVFRFVEGDVEAKAEALRQRYGLMG